MHECVGLTALTSQGSFSLLLSRPPKTRTGCAGAGDGRAGTVGGVTCEHPLATPIAAAAAGRNPVVDGSWRRMPPWRLGLEAIIAFTGHAVLAVADDIPGRLLVSLGADGFDVPMIRS